ncbi:hypothetical protein ACJX0J_025449, partial [Zea mays]
LDEIHQNICLPFSVAGDIIFNITNTQETCQYRWKAYIAAQNMINHDIWRIEQERSRKHKRLIVFSLMVGLEYGKGTVQPVLQEEICRGNFLQETLSICGQQPQTEQLIYASYETIVTSHLFLSLFCIGMNDILLYNEHTEYEKNKVKNNRIEPVGSIKASHYMAKIIGPKSHGFMYTWNLFELAKPLCLLYLVLH